MKKIIIFDTTLRDGEQAPGAALDVPEKRQIAKQLAKLNVDVIEAGFPISSPGDFKAVEFIASEIVGKEICALARVKEKDIKTAWDAIKTAEKPRLHTFVGTSNYQLREVLKKTEEQVLKMAVIAVRYACSLCKTVEFSPMDATRTELSYLYEVIEATIEAGAKIINIPDTVGYAMPEEFGHLISNICGNVPNCEKAVISVHCHDDLGMAVANSIAALENGAQQVECAINGLGERAGNASLEEIVMAIKTREDYFADAYTEINTKEIYPTSSLVSRLMGMIVAPNKAVVGANAFSHSSGIHQDGVIKEKKTFEIMKPEDVGRGTEISGSEIILSPRSGRNALRNKLSKFGYEVTKDELEIIYKRFLEIAEKKKVVVDEDLVIIYLDEIHSVPDIFALDFIQVLSGTNLSPTATVGIKKGDLILKEAANGNGPVDAAFKAIDKITGISLELDDYKTDAVTPGTDAIGEVMIKVRDNNKLVIGRGASTDVIEASAKAYIAAINKVLWLRESAK